MTPFRSLLCVGCAAILASHSLGQTSSTVADLPQEKTIEGWLFGGNPRLVAWGAHDALIARDRNLIPDLLSLASRWQALSRQDADASTPSGLSQDQLDEGDAMAAVLDALIQMEVTVPADTLRSLAADFGNDVAVLLSRLPAEEAESVDVDFYRSPGKNGLQYVSAALLALRPVPGFAADLLSKTSVQAKVFVVLPQLGLAGSGGCSACAVSSERRRKGWPSIGQYALSKNNSDGALLLVEGIDPIYATRKESPHYLGDACGMGVYLGQEERRRLVAEMLSIAPETIPWKTELSINIEFESLEQFNHAVLTLVDEEQAKYRATVAALADRGLLTSAEAQESLPQLELRLEVLSGYKSNGKNWLA